MRRPRVLVTRPAEDAAPLAGLLRGRGWEPLVEPMLEIVWLDGPPPDIDGVQALLFTSANGVRGYARRTSRRDRPAYAVGDATARAAREAGFAVVESASGDVYALAALAAARCTPQAGPLLHVAGTRLAGDLASHLAEKGFLVQRETLYDAVPSTHLSKTTVDALRTGTLAAVLFFSPRTARSFVRLLDGAGLSDRCRTVDALCLSPAVAEAARTYGALGAVPWQSVRVAPRPEQEALLGLLPDPSGGGG